MSRHRGEKLWRKNKDDLKKKKQTLLQLFVSLQEDADQLPEEAEGKVGTLMVQLITKSYMLRKR